MRRHHRERGASLVEFALVVPLLSMFLFGIVQFGLAYDMRQSINSAAREGARMAAIPVEPKAGNPGVTYAGIRDRVASTFNSVQNGSLDSVTVEVRSATNPTAPAVRRCDASGCTPATSPPSQSPCTGQAGNNVVVTATDTYDLTIPFVGVRSVTLTGRGEFRCEIDA